MRVGRKKVSKRSERLCLEWGRKLVGGLIARGCCRPVVVKQLYVMSVLIVS